jgi:hypothetical protein
VHITRPNQTTNWYREHSIGDLSQRLSPGFSHGGGADKQMASPWADVAGLTQSFDDDTCDGWCGGPNEPAIHLGCHEAAFHQQPFPMLS